MPPTTKPLSLPGPGSLPGPKRQNSLNLHIALCALLLWITCHNLPQPTGRPLNNPLPATHTVAAPNPQHVTLSDSPKALPLGPDLPASHAPAPFKMPPIRPRPQTPSRPHPHLPQAPPTSTPLSSAASCIPQPTLQARLVSLQRSEAPPQSASRAFSISFA